MYNIEWDCEINGILLTGENTDLPSPRPVFYEELDLLDFDGWEYPKSENPLLWSIGRRYYYKGKLVATAKKGNALEKPTIKFEEGYENLKLDEIDLNEVIERNKDALFVLENEAIDFIVNTFTKYPDYPLSVSFSGGKDSQSVLDLVFRVMGSNDLNIIFSDTTLEHEYTYSTVEETIDMYKEKNPKLKYNIAKPVKSASELFEDMGLPSRFNRWCTPVLKTAPYNKLINELVRTTNKIIVFEGVRAEESAKRSKYKQIADGVKHPSVINARPILYWNYTEVMLYNFYRNLPLNPLYRFGLSRVGCDLCPYASIWSECIHAHIGNKFNEEYIPLIKDYAKNRGVSEEKDLDDFVAEGHWKKRAGGLGLTPESAITFSQNLKSFKAISLKPNENFLEWIKVIGNVTYYKKDNAIKGELDLDGKYVSFNMTYKNNKQVIEFFNIQDDIKIQNKIKKILQKSTFCIHCGVCDVECPKRAIKTKPKVQINSNLCDHCENCINFTRHGCYRAKSVDTGSGGNNMRKRTTGIDRYSTFGLRQQWLEEFFNFGEEWFENNNLGPKQIPAVNNWLSEANLITDTKTKQITPLAKDLKEIYEKDPYFVWGIIWTNLYYNSKVINWYCDSIEWNTRLSREDLIERIMESFPDLSKGTLENATNAMINTFKNSPLNEAFELCNLEKKGQKVTFIEKVGGNNNLDLLLIAYTLFKLSEKKSRKDFIVSELYDENIEGGPYKLFGVSQEKLETILRGLEQYDGGILNVNLAADLENIFLNENISIEDLIKFKKEVV